MYKLPIIEPIYKWSAGIFVVGGITMQALSKAKIGEIYTIKWLLGLPEVVEFLHRHHVEEGGSIRIIQKLQTGMIVDVQGERFALGNEIADRIQV